MNWFRERLILFIVGFGLVLSLFLVKLIQNPYEYSRSAHGGTQTELTVDNSPQKRLPEISSQVGKKTRPSLHEPVASPQPERDEWRSERDLEAQRDMAKWAKYMFLASVVMAVLSAVGILLILGTLIVTQRAAKSASEATEAAWEAVNITRKTAVAQLRPYLELGDITVRFNKPDKDGIIRVISQHAGELVDLDLEIINHGLTPAIDVEIRISLDLTIYDIDNIDGEGGNIDGMFGDRTKYIGPNKGRYTANMLFGLKDFENNFVTELNSLSAVISADVTIQFTDSFRDDRVTISARYSEIFGTDAAPERLPGVIKLRHGKMAELTHT